MPVNASRPRVRPIVCLQPGVAVGGKVAEQTTMTNVCQCDGSNKKGTGTESERCRSPRAACAVSNDTTPFAVEYAASADESCNQELFNKLNASAQASYTGINKPNVLTMISGERHCLCQQGQRLDDKGDCVGACARAALRARVTLQTSTSAPSACTSATASPTARTTSA